MERSRGCHEFQTFFEKNCTPPQCLRPDIPHDVKYRILAILQERTSQNHSFASLLNGVGSVLVKAYGGLTRGGYECIREDNPVIEHFMSCQTPYALDFIEVCLQQFEYAGEQTGVDEINEVFREHGVGYELTPWREKQRHGCPTKCPNPR